jgi:hypothetical protein
MRFLVNPEEEDARGWAVQHWNIFLESSPAEKAKREVLSCFWKTFGKKAEKETKRKNSMGEENKRKVEKFPFIATS